MKVVVAITGASGVNLGIKAYNLLDCEKHLIVTDGAKEVMKSEGGNIWLDSQIAAPPASGSYGADAMLIAPCSMDTLAKIACGIADNLTTRSASVMIKERKKLVIAPRELPFSSIALENMLKLSNLGVFIAPPAMAYYGNQNSLDDMENFIIGRWFDLLGVQNSLYPRWGEN